MIQLLNELEVNKVISIDNEYNEYNLDYIGEYIWDNRLQFKDSLNKYKIKFADEDIFWASFDKNYKTLVTGPETKELFDNNKKTLEYLDKVFSDDLGTLDYEKLGGNQEDVDYIMSLPIEETSLIIIDKVLDNINGIDIIKQLFDKRKFSNNFIILLSNEESDESLNQTYNALEEQLPKSRISVLSKSTLIGKEPEELNEIIKLEIHKQYLNLLISNLMLNTTEANENVNNALLHLEKGFLDGIVFQFADFEGVQPVENLLRIYNSEFDYYLRKSIADKINVYSKLIYKYEKNFKNFKKTEFNIAEMYSFLKHEKFDESINQLFKTPAFGDIYIINEKLYILVSQECDLIVRGPRGNPSRKLNKGFLINLVKKGIDATDSNAVKYFSTDNNNYYSLCPDFNEVIMIEMLMLDLCAYNELGKAYINIESMYDRNGLHTEKYHNYILNSYNNLINQINEKSIEKISEKINSSYKLKSDIESENKLNLNISRLCRLEFNSTYQLFQRYISNITRYPIFGDYGKKKRIINLVMSKSEKINLHYDVTGKEEMIDRVYFDEDIKGKYSKNKVLSLVSNKYGTDKEFFEVIDSNTVLIHNAYNFKKYYNSGKFSIQQEEDSGKLMDYLERKKISKRYYTKKSRSYNILLENLNQDDRIMIDTKSYIELEIIDDNLKCIFVEEEGD